MHQYPRPGAFALFADNAEDLALLIVATLHGKQGRGVKQQPRGFRRRSDGDRKSRSNNGDASGQYRRRRGSRSCDTAASTSQSGAKQLNVGVQLEKQDAWPKRFAIASDHSQSEGEGQSEVGK